MKRKTKHIRDLKAKILAARQVLKDLHTQHYEALDVLERMRQEYQALGPTIMEPPSPLPSEWGEEPDGSEYEESILSDDAGPQTYQAQPAAAEDTREQWQPVKKRKGRPTGQGNTQDPTDVQMQVNQQLQAGEDEEIMD